MSLHTSKLLITLKILAGVPHLIISVAVHALAFLISEGILLQKGGELPGLGLLPSTSRSSCLHLAPLQRCGSRSAPASHSDLSSSTQTHHQGCQLVQTGAYWVLRQPRCCAIAGKLKQPVPAVFLWFFFSSSLFFYYCMVTTIKSFLAWLFIWELFPYMTVLYPCVNYLMFHYTNRLHLQKWFPAGKNQMLELQVFCRGGSVLQTVRSGVKTCSQLLGWSS